MSGKNNYPHSSSYIVSQNIGIPLMILTVPQPKDVTILQKASNKKGKI